MDNTWTLGLRVVLFILVVMATGLLISSRRRLGLDALLPTVMLGICFLEPTSPGPQPGVRTTMFASPSQLATA